MYVEFLEQSVDKSKDSYTSLIKCHMLKKRGHFFEKMRTNFYKLLYWRTCEENTMELEFKWIKRNEGNWLFLSLNIFPFQTFWLFKKFTYIYSINRSGLRTNCTRTKYTRRLNPNSFQPKFKSKSQINIRGVDIKAWFFVEIMID